MTPLQQLLLLGMVMVVGRCGGVPLVLPSSGLRAALSGRQVAPSQGILGELQQLFREAAAGQQTQAAYGAARDGLEQIVSSLDRLAAVVPQGQRQDSDQGTTTTTTTTTTETPADVPIIDPGLFVIQGVQTCGAGAGYCMLGTNCSVDTDFSADTLGHCAGLRSAFSPPAEFSCCQFEAARRRTATPRPTPTTTEGSTFDDGLVDSIVNFDSKVPEKPTDDSSQVVDIVAIITDSTGIVDIVTRPYTGPWPPVDNDDGEGVTLPFAKPGQTFEPGSLVGLGQNVQLHTKTDSFQAGDLPPEEEQQGGVTAAPAEDSRITPAATTPATPAGSTPATAESTAAEPPPPAAGEPLGPLASVPVMDQSLDYIGEVDYDQHLMPALMPIRPGSKADEEEPAVESSGAGEQDGDGGGDGDDLLEVTQDYVEGSGFDGAVEEAEEEQQDQPQQTLAEDVKQTIETEQTKAAVTEKEETELSVPVSEDMEPSVPVSEDIELSVPVSADAEPSVPVSEDMEPSVPVLEDMDPSVPVSADMKPSVPVSEGAVQTQKGRRPAGGTKGSLSASSSQPACGVMGSSLATLLARNQYRPRSDDSAVGGQVTSAVVWCWMAAIMRKTHDPENPYSFVCSGTLVERDLVVTTASCASRLFREPLRNFVVLLGASNLRVSLEFGVQHMELDEIVVHEDYQLNNHVHANNIGLLKLSRQAVLERTVCLLCLPPQSMEIQGRQNCAVTGYGPSESPQSAGLQADYAPELAGVLRQTEVPVLGRSQCRASGAMQRLTAVLPSLDESTFLCAGGQRSSVACHISRDGGSPLACMAADTRRYYLFGHVSWDDGQCDDDSEPHVYTSMASLFPWIRDNYGRMARKLPAETAR